MKKVLIVDDEQDIVESLQFVLEAAGFECHCAWQWRRKVIFGKRNSAWFNHLDVMMPKINGFKICRLLKYDNKYKNIPILIGYSAFADWRPAIGEEQALMNILQTFWADEICWEG